MKIEDYHTQINILFHDIRKEGYCDPVSYAFLCGNFENYIEKLPLVRGRITCTNFSFSVRSAVGFKNGVYYVQSPEFITWNPTRRPGQPTKNVPHFVFRPLPDGPFMRTFKLANCGEYYSFLRALNKYLDTLKGVSIL